MNTAALQRPRDTGCLICLLQPTGTGTGPLCTLPPSGRSLPLQDATDSHPGGVLCRPRADLRVSLLVPAPAHFGPPHISGGSASRLVRLLGRARARHNHRKSRSLALCYRRSRPNAIYSTHIQHTLYTQHKFNKRRRILVSHSYIPALSPWICPSRSQATKFSDFSRDLTWTWQLLIYLRFYTHHLYRWREPNTLPSRGRE